MHRGPAERPTVYDVRGDTLMTGNGGMENGSAWPRTRFGSSLDGDVERAFHPCNISSKETNDRGENYHEGNRGNRPGCGNGRDEAGGAARAAGSDKRRHRSDSCVGIRPG